MFMILSLDSIFDFILEFVPQIGLLKMRNSSLEIYNFCSAKNDTQRQSFSNISSFRLPSIIVLNNVKIGPVTFSIYEVDSVIEKMHILKK